jgi:hypothetical protein
MPAMREFTGSIAALQGNFALGPILMISECAIYSTLVDQGIALVA